MPAAPTSPLPRRLCTLLALLGFLAVQVQADCVSPTLPATFQKSLPNPTLPRKQDLVIACVPGYSLSTGAFSYRVWCDGTKWEDADGKNLIATLKCTPGGGGVSVTCVVPKAPSNGDVEITENPPVEFTIASFRCKAGYKLNDQPTLVCRSGVWKDSSNMQQGVVPQCLASSDPGTLKNCATLTKPANGVLFVSDNPPVEGTSAVFNCMSGYYVTGSKDQLCKSGQWLDKWTVEPATAVNCAKGDKPDSGSRETAPSGSDLINYGYCPALGPPVNGDLQLKSPYEGEKAVFTCKNGYYLSGASAHEDAVRTGTLTLTCRSAKWIDEFSKPSSAPTCSSEASPSSPSNPSSPSSPSNPQQPSNPSSPSNPSNSNQSPATDGGSSDNGAGGDGGGGGGGGSTAGIVFGILLLIAVLAALVWIYLKRRNSSKQVDKSVAMMSSSTCGTEMTTTGAATAGAASGRGAARGRGRGGVPGRGRGVGRGSNIV